MLVSLGDQGLMELVQSRIAGLFRIMKEFLWVLLREALDLVLGEECARVVDL